MGVIQVEGVGDVKDEMPHCLWFHQRLAVVRSAEAGGIDGDYVRGGCQVRPRRLEGIYAFRPRAHQDRVGTATPKAAKTVAAKPTVAWDYQWGGGFMSPRMFTGLVFEG